MVFNTEKDNAVEGSLSSIKNDRAGMLSSKNNKNIEHNQDGIFEKFFNLSLDMLCVARVDGTFKKLNTAFVEVLGYSEAELLNKPFISFIHPDDIESTNNELKKLSQGYTTLNFENRYRKKDGTYVVLVWSSVPEVNTGLLYAVAHDVTEIRKKEKELSQIMDAVDRSSMVIVADKKARIINVNNNFKTLIGHSKDEVEIEGMTLDKFYNLSKSECKKMQKCIKEGKIWKGETQIILQNSNTCSLLTLISPIVDHEGKLIRILSICENITHQKEAMTRQIVSSKLMTLGEMSAGIAHEINNPLAIIEGNVQLIPRFLNDPKMLNNVIESTIKSCSRISKIVLGLKKFTRSSDSILKVSSTLSDIVKEAISLVEYKSKRDMTQVFFDNSSQSKIECNVVQIEQVVINLIMNALDAVRGKHQRWVKVTVFDENDSVYMQIMDSGKGISLVDYPQIFDPFFTTKKGAEGTGLGLSITKVILNAHNATIRLLEDSPNTCFEIKFKKVS